ncbi:glycosyl hydrolase 108 family protein [Methylotenera sp.]|uniref:glycoside hydrolase family 108 protein n=1 Tax=Methylotenera sp. TaxID=2051956 RepID=UPI0024893038|nr:glycosyl hydrolase 108 family protein [Methylotenera sp.]MDI1362522.1 glycosyl hydrolase 108 family protein [Methylotenera sp.]
MKFEDMFTRLLGHEGNYSNDPNDAGGETKFGISKRSYPAYDIKNLSVEQAKLIYKRDFWDALNADNLYDGVAWQLFDFAINSGVGTAIRGYQRALGVADDGFFGAHSLKASNAMTESDQIMRVISERMRYMVKCKGWKDFGAGWINRMATNLYFGADDS